MNIMPKGCDNMLESIIKYADNAPKIKVKIGTAILSIVSNMLSHP